MAWEGAVARWAPLHRGSAIPFRRPWRRWAWSRATCAYESRLTDTANVIKSPGSDITGLSKVQDKLRSIPLGVTDPKALCEALEYQVERTVSGTVFTLAEIPLPGGGSIPLTVDVATLAGALGGGS